MAGILTVARIEARKLLGQRAVLILSLLLLLCWKGIVLLEMGSGPMDEGFLDFEVNGFYLMARSARFGLALWVALLMVLAAHSIAGEAERGQLRMLLVRPVSRRTYYLGKQLALWAVILLVLLVDGALGLLCGSLSHGFGDVADTSLQGDLYGAASLSGQLLRAYLLTGLALAATGSIALCISALFRQATTAITVSLLFLLLAAAVGFVYGAPLDRFLVTTWDVRSFSTLEQLTSGTSVYQPPSEIVWACAVPLLTAVVTTLVGVIVFRQRDLS